MDAQYWVSCNGSTLSKPLCLRFRKDYLGLIQRKAGPGSIAGQPRLCPFELLLQPHRIAPSSAAYNSGTNIRKELFISNGKKEGNYCRDSRSRL